MPAKNNGGNDKVSKRSTVVRDLGDAFKISFMPTQKQA